MGLRVGDVTAPVQRLAVEVVEIREAAAGQEIRFDIRERAFDPAFAVRVSHPVRTEPEAKGAGKGRHLRGNDGVGTGARGEQNAGVVDDADRTDTRHEADRLQQERLGLEAGEPRVVLDEQPARVGQHQAGALRGDGLVGGANVTRCGEVSCCISWPGTKSYSPARRGGPRRSASLTQRVKVL